jgi:hypothetical protein
MQISPFEKVSKGKKLRWKEDVFYIMKKQEKIRTEMEMEKETKPAPKVAFTL